MPWWATIFTSTVIAKMTLLPFAIWRRTAKAMPNIHTAQKVFYKEFDQLAPNDYKKRSKMMWDMCRGASYALRIEKSSFTKIFAFPLLNAGFFITFIYTIRRLLLDSAFATQLEKGGLWWFTDLTSADATMVLPLSAAALTYSALHVSFGDAKGSLATFLRDFTQTVVILGLPFTTQLPAGVFLYWIPSTVFNIGQALLIKKLNRDAIRPPEMKPRPVEGRIVSEGSVSSSAAAAAAAKNGSVKGDSSSRSNQNQV